MQEWGIGALGNMAMDPDMQADIGVEGGCRAVVSAMRSHLESDNLLFHGCLALVRGEGREGGREGGRGRGRGRGGGETDIHVCTHV